MVSFGLGNRTTQLYAVAFQGHLILRLKLGGQPDLPNQSFSFDYPGIRCNNQLHLSRFSFVPSNESFQDFLDRQALKKLHNLSHVGKGEEMAFGSQ